MAAKVKLIFGGAFVNQSCSDLDFINKVFDTVKAGGLDILYIHAPDRRISLEDQLETFHQLHQAGKFKRFGLSNFLADEVEDVVRICREKNYVLPSVYQGNYSPVARRADTDILPTLRKHNISFYAYSPIAGGFLTKDVDTLVKDGDGRMLEGLKLWEEISKGSGIAKDELAYRWVAYNSHLKGEFGDVLIFDVRTLEQVNQTLTGLKKGPLPSHIAEQIESVWKIVLLDAPLENFNSYLGKRNEQAA
ncbi:hypothetical protein N7451_004846 [Penicillium sp. IBT 35674x]|nr:hypothetical protein N7451_004846 [Penicillium sp. IBT 35674x]